MAKISLIMKSQRPPKFSSRGYTRCRPEIIFSLPLPYFR